jgi:hypothetical protein
MIAFYKVDPANGGANFDLPGQRDSGDWTDSTDEFPPVAAAAAALPHSSQPVPPVRPLGKGPAAGEDRQGASDGPTATGTTPGARGKSRKLTLAQVLDLLDRAAALPHGWQQGVGRRRGEAAQAAPPIASSKRCGTSAASIAGAAAPPVTTRPASTRPKWPSTSRWSPSAMRQQVGVGGNGEARGARGRAASRRGRWLQRAGGRRQGHHRADSLAGPTADGVGRGAPTR